MKRISTVVIALFAGAASLAAIAQPAGKGTLKDGASYEKSLGMSGMSGMAGMSGDRSSTAEPAKKAGKEAAKKPSKAEKKAEKKAEEKKAQ